MHPRLEANVLRPAPKRPAYWLELALPLSTPFVLVAIAAVARALS